jgi:hypothetical protein
MSGEPNRAEQNQSAEEAAICELSDAIARVNEVLGQDLFRLCPDEVLKLVRDKKFRSNFAAYADCLEALERKL